MKPEVTPFPRYLRILLGVLAPVWLVVVVTNFIVDPYDAFGTDGDEVKAAFQRNTRLSKALAVARLQPDAIALGTSRTDHAIDVSNPVFAAGGERSYNLALDGAHIREIAAYLEHAQELHPLRRVLLGLDFGSFGRFRAQHGFDPSILASDAGSRRVARGFKLLEVYASLDALEDSLMTVRKSDAAPDYDLASGRRLDSVFEGRIARYGSVRGVFENYTAEGMRNSVAAPIRREHLAESLQVLRDVVGFCEQHSIDLRLFISPAHSRTLESRRALGSWELYEAWKRGVVDVLASDGASGTRFPLWDFSGYNSVTTESLPVGYESTDELQWYWESSHFKRAVGDRVLERVFTSADDAAAAPDDFGVLVTPANIDAHLEQVRAAGARYREHNAAQFSDIYALAKKLYPVTK